VIGLQYLYSVPVLRICIFNIRIRIQLFFLYPDLDPGFFMTRKYFFPIIFLFFNLYHFSCDYEGIS